MNGLRKILAADQIRLVDTYTIEHKSIPSIELMEQAALAFVEAIEPRLSQTDRILVCSGPGNNGGDGLAVARILRSMHYHVDIRIMESEHYSEDYSKNLMRIVGYQYYDSSFDLSEYHVIIDGLLGTGISRAAEGNYAAFIHAINETNADVYSIDIPSGMHSDHMHINGPIVKADHVVSFQRPKFVFFIPEADPYIGSWEVKDIGLIESFIQSQDSPYYLLDNEVLNKIKKRRRFTHKGTYGHACILAGSSGQLGAAILATKSCMRSGAGLTSTCVHQEAFSAIHQTAPEALCIDRSAIEIHLYNNTFSVIGCGPGLGTDMEAVNTLNVILKNPPTSGLVLDADAINIIAQQEDLCRMLPEGSILTPHPKEFSRLVGTYEDSLQRLHQQKAFSKKHKVVLVVKDAHTIITDPIGNVYFNTSGNAGMATGGSGDVLLGIITGLKAQGYGSLEAALLGVYCHGVAGDRASTERGQYALIASDIINHLRFDGIGIN